MYAELRHRLMKFNFFSSTAAHTALPSALTRSVREDLELDAERTALTTALYGLLEELPQSFSGGDHLQRLCETVLHATPCLRLAWVGFCESDAVQTAPHTVLGEALPEATDWQLPPACFEQSTPYSQIALESVGALNNLNSLFLPWHANMEACTVNCALAIPLRSEKPAVRGLIVFYADDVNYFSRLGIAPFQAFAHVAEIIWQQSSLMQVLTQNAQQDTLTGLMNRRKMTYLLQKGIQRAQQQHELLSIMLLRIDGFSRINELHGWNAADSLLTAFAKEIALQMRAQDRLGRWTGVEFLCVLPRTDQQHAEFLARGLQTYFASQPLTIDGQPIHLKLHAGVATYPQQGASLEALLEQALVKVQQSAVTSLKNA